MSTMLNRVAPDLIGIGEIARLMGVSRQYVDRLSRQDPNFPEPALELASGRAWKRQAIDGWLRDRSG